MAAEGGAGTGEGVGLGSGDGEGEGPGDGEGEGPGDGEGEGPGDGLGVGEGPPQDSLNQIHVVDDAHIPSLDLEAVPVLHLATSGHQPRKGVMMVEQCHWKTMPNRKQIEPGQFCRQNLQVDNCP